MPIDDKRLRRAIGSWHNADARIEPAARIEMDSAIAELLAAANEKRGNEMPSNEQFLRDRIIALETRVKQLESDGPMDPTAMMILNISYPEALRRIETLERIKRQQIEDLHALEARLKELEPTRVILRADIAEVTATCSTCSNSVQ